MFITIRRTGRTWGVFVNNDLHEGGFSAQDAAAACASVVRAELAQAEQAAARIATESKYPISMTFHDAEQAFNDAIAAGRLSMDRAAANYAGNYMYMCTGQNGVDQFKNIDTRRYDV